MTCPVCSKSTEQRYRPFCSRRCADIDLGHWFNEDYSIPTEDEAESESGEQPGTDRGSPRGALAH